MLDVLVAWLACVWRGVHRTYCFPCVVVYLEVGFPYFLVVFMEGSHLVVEGCVIVGWEFVYQSMLP